jgi:hypothetical protein
MKLVVLPFMSLVVNAILLTIVVMYMHNSISLFYFNSFDLFFFCKNIFYTIEMSPLGTWSSGIKEAMSHI